MLRKLLLGLLAASVCLLVGGRVRADGEGQGDLDKATELKVTAETLDQLDEVGKLCESALKKGLDDENAKFARKLLTSSLYEYASRLAAEIFDRTPPNQQWPAIRQVALQKLEHSLEFDDKQGNVNYLIARLQSLPGGDKERALKAATAAVRLAGDDKKELSKALVLRGLLTTDEDRRLGDFNQAVLIDPTNTEALQVRGAYHLTQENYEKAAADFAKLLEADGDNVNAEHALSEALIQTKDFDKAFEHANKAVEIDPKNALSYTIRARIYLIKNEPKKALADLNKALELKPGDASTLLMRARYYLFENDIAKAKEDVNQALAARPGLVEGILLRSAIAAEEKRYDDAISDIRGLLRVQPKNVEWRLQLAGYYVGSERPRHAIDIYDELIAEDPQNWMALRGRGDALLSVGKHAEAIKDYEQVLKVEPEHSGALNNLAWVLATSTIDKLRDGRRAIELAKKACELTDYKAAHILSTLASGYAETGDFEEAKKWSKKAVEAGEGSEVKEQLEKELESYKQKKPWREMQKVEEKPDLTEPSGGSLRL